jgi:membrane protease YdiL (CAAX protease family)
VKFDNGPQPDPVKPDKTDDLQSPIITPERGKTPASTGDRRSIFRYGPFTAIFGALAIYFLSQIAASLVLLIYPLSQHWSRSQTNDWLTSSITAQFVLLLLIEVLTVVFVWRLLGFMKMKLRDIGVKRPKPGDFAYTLAGFAVYFVSFAVIVFILQHLIPSLNYEQKQQLGFDSVKGHTQLVLTFISLVILPPIGEEILVRGYLFSGLRKRYKWLTAALVTSLLFGLAHLQFGSGAPLLWTAGADTFVLSMVLCYMREKTGNIWPGVALHAIKNSIAFIGLYLMR